ncbi:MAG: 2-isopropylmalate synthase [Thermodesulfobacteriota bacterium]
MGDWERINSSPLNAMEEVRQEMHLPAKVALHDTTLRDGEQFPGVVFTREDKIRIGRALSECGVHRIEIMPAVSREDQEVTAELNSMGLSAEVVGFCRCLKDDVQKAADAGCKAVEMEIMAYPRGLQAQGWSFEEATGKMIEVSHFARSMGMRVTVFFVCVLQAPLEFSKQFIQKVLAEGAADAVCIPDTFGTCMPHAIYHYVRELRKWTDKPIEIHPHNMYSLGAADALAGVMAGAEVVHVCVNGLGEGAGNAPLEAVAMDLPLMLGVDTGVRLEKIYDLCKLVENISRVSLQANWPLVGDRVFTTESGITVDFFTKLARSGAGVPPAQDIATILGRKRQVVLGKMSGRTSIEVKLAQLGLPAAGEEALKDILERVKSRSIEIHDALGDEEFKKIVAQIAGS